MWSARRAPRCAMALAALHHTGAAALDRLAPLLLARSRRQQAVLEAPPIRSALRAPRCARAIAALRRTGAPALGRLAPRRLSLLKLALLKLSMLKLALLKLALLKLALLRKSGAGKASPRRCQWMVHH